MTKRRGISVLNDEAVVAHLNGETKRKWSEKDIKTINPKTSNQEKVFREYQRGQNLFLSGFPGVGKSFLAIYLGLNTVLSSGTKDMTLKIVRSIVPTRDPGALPGELEEKLSPYEDPYVGIFDSLFSYKKSYENLKKYGKVEFICTSYIRSCTWNNSIVIVDEAQNLNFHELDSVITRGGYNTRFIFCGDGNQTDMTKEKDIKGYDIFSHIIRELKQFSVIDFTVDDVVRSNLIKDYLIARERIV